MARTSPAETFAHAQAAMARGDWDGFFECVDRGDLLEIASNGVNLLSTTPAFAALCAEHAVPDAIGRLPAIAARITESARRSPSHGGPSDTAGLQAMMDHSRRHQALVDEYRAALHDGLSAIADLGRFTAALERAMRAATGGGSVSSRLLVDEALEDVSIAGREAWATRRLPGDTTEDIGFVRRRGVWYIRLLARRPRGKA